MQERGVEADHSSLNGWVLKFTPALDKTFRQRGWRANGEESDGLVSGQELRNVLIVTRLLFLPRALSCH